MKKQPPDLNAELLYSSYCLLCNTFLVGIVDLELEKITKLTFL